MYKKPHRQHNNGSHLNGCAARELFTVFSQRKRGREYREGAPPAFIFSLIHTHVVVVRRITAKVWLWLWPAACGQRRGREESYLTSSFSENDFSSFPHSQQQQRQRQQQRSSNHTLHGFIDPWLCFGLLLYVQNAATHLWLATVSSSSSSLLTVCLVSF